MHVDFRGQDKELELGRSNSQLFPQQKLKIYPRLPSIGLSMCRKRTKKSNGNSEEYGLEQLANHSPSASFPQSSTTSEQLDDDDVVRCKFTRFFLRERETGMNSVYENLELGISDIAFTTPIISDSGSRSCAHPLRRGLEIDPDKFRRSPWRSFHI